MRMGHALSTDLQHILNNASGSLRPLVQEVCAQRLTADDIQRGLNTIYYPIQMFQYLGLAEADDATRAAFVPQTIPRAQYF